MPAISVQMSGSSSTMRMSGAMRPSLTGSRIIVRRSGTADAISSRLPEYQTDARAATLAVVQREIAAVIFHDLLDDRETQAGALAARRHVGLGQALAPLLRQAVAIVLDDDATRSSSLSRKSERDLARWQLPPVAAIRGLRSPRPAFLRMLVSTCPIWRRSQISGTGMIRQGRS